MRAFFNLSVIELRLFFRERQSVFWTFLYPVAMLWLFGVMFGKYQVDGVSYSNAYVPSWIGVNLLTISLFTIGTTLANYREREILKRYQATPIRSYTVLGAHAVLGIVIFLISAVIMVVEGTFLFNLSVPKSISGLLLSLAVSLFAMFPFGLFLASIVKNTRAAAALATVVLNVMLLFSGATFPLQEFPPSLQQVAKALPLYYVVDLLRKAWNSASLGSSVNDVWILLAICIVTSVLAARLFRWQAD